MRLYSYWRSTTSYRVRIALNLKGLDYQTLPVDLVAGEQYSDSYKSVNPVAGVPSLELPAGQILTQSMAILNWLERQYPTPALLPEDPTEAALVHAAALVIATDVHPVNNLRVVKQLKTMGHSQEATVTWMNDWMSRGLMAFQDMIPDAHFSFGDQVTLADVCLVAQLYNAHRWGLDMAPFARLVEIETRCLALPAFDAARPENQPDAG